MKQETIAKKNLELSLQTCFLCMYSVVIFIFIIESSIDWALCSAKSPVIH
jgi:hypothetical protein